jgi:hypothetical protein
MTDVVCARIGVDADFIDRREDTIVRETAGVFCADDPIITIWVFWIEYTAGYVTGIHRAEQTVVAGKISCGVDTSLGFSTGIRRAVFSIIACGVIQAMDASGEDVAEVVRTVDAINAQEIIGEFCASLDGVTDVVGTFVVVVT